MSEHNPDTSPDVASAAPPYDIAAEMAVLGSMLLASGAAIPEADALLSESDFYRPTHSVLFSVMLALSERGEPVDIVTLNAELTIRGILEKIGGLSYLMQLGEVEFTTRNLPYYAAIVKERAILRRLMSEAAALFHEAQNGGGGDVPGFLASVQERMVQATTPAKGAEGFRLLKDLVNQSWEDLDERLSRGDVLTGFPTGFLAIDRKTGGFQDGDLIVLAARPAMGKTAMLCNICTNAAKHHRRVAFFSLEMPAIQIVTRMKCALARVDSQRYRTPSLLTPDEYERLRKADEQLWTGEVQIEDTSGLTIAEVCARARRLHARAPLDLVMVDYLQQIASDDRDRKSENRTQEISAMARRLKALARELSCPVVLLSQLSRAVEKREDKRPMLSDLYESGGIEAAADLVLALYRPAYYLPQSEEGAEPSACEETEVLFLKYRNGEQGVVKLGFEARFAQFYNLEGRYDEQQ